MASHLYMEIQLICIVFFAVLLYRIMKTEDRRISQLYFILLLFASIACFTFDFAQTIVNELNPTNEIAALYVCNILYYIALGGQCYYWFMYSEAEQESRVVASKRLRYLAMIGWLIIALMAVTAPFNHLLFYVTDEGVYTRGSLHIVQLIISYLYLGSTAIKAFVGSLRATNISTKEHLRTVAYQIVPVFITSALQVLWPNLPLICAGCADSLLFCHLAMQEENISLDPLTGVNNRRRLLRNMEDLIERAQDGGQPFGVLMIDADNFKGINDTYGHVEGDRALVHIGRVLKSLGKPGLNIYRYGGDEFIVTSDDGSEAELAEVAQQIQTAVAIEAQSMEAPYSLSVSVGYTTYEKSDTTPAALIERADQHLYEQKRNKK